MKLAKLVVIASVSLVLASCGSEGDKKSAIKGKLTEGEKIASRGDVEIHEGFIELIGNINPNINAQLKTPAGKKRLVDNLLDQEALYQESLKRGIPDLPKYKEKAALYERVIFAQGLVEEGINAKAKEYYEQNKENEFSQVEVAHILIRTQPKRGKRPAVTEEDALKKAQEAKAKLDKGVVWTEVVEEYSDDRLTKKREGALGKLSRGDRRAGRLEWREMIDQAFTMKADEISEPIKAKDGYHIIKVIKEAAVSPYEEVQTTIQFKLRGPVKNEILAEIRGDGTTEYYDEELKALAQPETPQEAPATESQTAEGGDVEEKSATSPEPTADGSKSESGTANAEEKKAE